MISAFYYDGKSALRQPVDLFIANGLLLLRGAGFALKVKLSEVDFGEPLAGAPRCIELRDGARCEVADEAALARLLAAAGVGDSAVVKLQKSWRWALGSFVLVVAASASAYWWGLPEIARVLAQQIPPAAVQKISRDALAQLDRQHFTPSKLPPERQQQIRARATDLLGGQGMPPWRLQFRASRQLGSNAFALPGGDIVLLDPLVAQLNDAEIDAVLAHEVGHLAERHALRMLIQSAAMSIALAAWFGDVSSAAVGVSGLLLQSGYSRRAELEADAYAARLLLRCCQSVEALVSSLDKIERRGRHASDLLDSHPETRERIAAIRALQP
jgi:Zn-dependent protease with chaperone function